MPAQPPPSPAPPARTKTRDLQCRPLLRNVQSEAGQGTGVKAQYPRANLDPRKAMLDATAMSSGVISKIRWSVAFSSG